MKKTRLLLLLVPSFFLASCQTTPKIDTITEEEAINFINEHFTKEKFDVAPVSATSRVKWNISKDDNGDAKQHIGFYIFNDQHAIGDQDDGNNGLNIESERCSQYLTELTDDSDFYNVGQDAIVGMNKKIYEKLHNSLPNEVSPYELVYKPAGSGLIIICQSTSTQTIYTRTHTYNEYGQETNFEVKVNQDGLAYTMNIEFKYN